MHISNIIIIFDSHRRKLTLPVFLVPSAVRATECIATSGRLYSTWGKIPHVSLDPSDVSVRSTSEKTCALELIDTVSSSVVPVQGCHDRPGSFPARRHPAVEVAVACTAAAVAFDYSFPLPVHQSQSITSARGSVSTLHHSTLQ